MKRLVVIILVFIGFSLKAQLTVSTGALTPTQYVQNVLVGGGVTVTNVTFSGQSNQIGEFNATNTNPYIGINTGIIMASGDVNVAVGPNNQTGATLGNGAGFGVNDVDLDVIAAIGTNDAAVLEFDFIPTGDTVKFNFVFGSEEYPEFVNSINDAFGFFLSGPGIAGPFTNNAINIALVPGTSTPVTINTVNSGSNASFYVNNNNQAGPANAIQFDGYTTVMTAIGVVQCGVQYHIKIAIADASDDILDSGVFLEAGSFSSNTVTLSSNIDISGNDSILYEGCGTAFLDFVRDNIADTSVYNFTITGTAGMADYTISGSSVVFLPGQDTVTLSFNALQDGLTEPLETVIIQLVQTICGVLDTQIVTFYISDYPLPILTTQDTVKPCGSLDSIPIWVNVVGPIYTTLWSTGQTTDTIWVNPTNTTTYYVTVSDTCGVYNVLDSAIVTVGNLQVTVADYTMSCLNEMVTLTANIVGGIGTEPILWSNGATTNSIVVSPSVTTLYWVSVNGACSATDTASITVPIFQAVGLTVNNNSSINCPGDPAILAANMVGGSQVQTYNWSDGTTTFTGNNITVNPIVTTTYTVSVLDTCANDSATTSFTVTVPVYAALQLTVSDDTLICIGDPANLVAIANGGDGNYSYSWTGGGGSASAIQVTPNFDINYTVTVTDGCGNQISSSVYVTVTAPTADFTYEYLSEFGVQFTDSSYYDIVSTWWTFDGDGIYTESNPLYNFYTDGQHEVWLAVLDINGCYDTIMKKIKPPMFIYGPNSFSPDGDGINDEFKFKGIGLKNFNLMIFNRWGEQIFEAHSIDIGWRGTYRGTPLPVGVYVYRVRAESFEGLVVEHAGSVTLIR